ncbi:MAG: hypothetical protein OXG85_08180 [Chloroflexi bacterium]|nr:hypothetical protein [Chloroflexota bacterium]
MAIVGAALLAACASIRPAMRTEPAPESGFRYLELLVDDDFAGSEPWRQYMDGDDLVMSARDGVYQIDFVGRQYVWAQRQGWHSDIVLEADATQASDFDHNAFGLACRLDPANSGRGYFFLISGDGYASIRWSNGRSLEPIVRAASSAAIRSGKASNSLRVVCIEDYLALWVNGQFVAEARDGRASAGAVGLAGVMNYAGRRLAVHFDDLKVWRAALDERE